MIDLPKISAFDILVLIHFTMDFLFQTNWEAKNKEENPLALVAHSFFYTAGFIPVFVIYRLNLFLLLTIFFSHIILDQRGFEKWWVEKIKGVKKEENPEIYNFLIIITDQVLHVLILGLVVFLD